MYKRQLLDDAWCKFFKENQFLIGLSIDGTKQLHDMYRHDKNGNPTFDRIKSAADLMDQYGVDYNILTVVTQNAAYQMCIRDRYLDSTLL